MKCDKKHMLLYAVTDRAWVGGKTLYQQVEEALRRGGRPCGPGGYGGGPGAPLSAAQ